MPQELRDFLREQELCALFHGADQGTLVILKASTPELESLGGTFPIGLEHQVWDHPQSPVIRSLLTFFDQPDAPLRLETFTNIADPDQSEPFAALAQQETIPILGFDEKLRHRLSKRLRNGTAEQIPMIVQEAEQLLTTIPKDKRDFDQAKQAVMEQTAMEVWNEEDD